MEAILSLGSNLGDRLRLLAQARAALASLPQTRLSASSRVYRTEPVDVPADFLKGRAGPPDPPGVAARVSRADGGWHSRRYSFLDGATAPTPPDFLNAVIVLETALTPSALLTAAQAIERQLGRMRSAIRNAPRTIDIDLICCGDLRLDTPALQLPHPRAHLRRFVCEPLAELRPDLMLPGQRLPIRALLAALPALPSVSLAAEQWA